MGALVAARSLATWTAATSHMRALLALCLGLRAAYAAEPLGVLGMGSNVVDKFYRLRGAGGMKDVMGAKGYFAALMPDAPGGKMKVDLDKMLPLQPW